MYAFGMIAKEITGSSSITLSLKYRIHLSWLISKCLEQNPEKRIHPMEALCFLFTLDKILSASIK